MLIYILVYQHALKLVSSTTKIAALLKFDQTLLSGA